MSNRNRRRTARHKARAGKVMDKLGRNGQDMGGYTLPKDVAEEVMRFIDQGRAVIGPSFDWGKFFKKAR